MASGKDADLRENLTNIMGLDYSINPTVDDVVDAVKSLCVKCSVTQCEQKGMHHERCTETDEEKSRIFVGTHHESCTETNEDKSEPTETDEEKSEPTETHENKYNVFMPEGEMGYYNACHEAGITEEYYKSDFEWEEGELGVFKKRGWSCDSDEDRYQVKIEWEDGRQKSFSCWRNGVPAFPEHHEWD